MTETLIQPATLVELLRYRATTQPDGHAYTFLIDGKKETPPLTYSELDRQARAIAAYLQKYQALGERALLLYPQSLE
ncbi:MAG: AMP-dependent synthetase, partial [Microcystis sp.]